MKLTNRRLPKMNTGSLTRFHSYYEKYASGCWVWSKGRSLRGYGVFWTSGGQYPAHRISYLVHFGSDPGSMLVCHKCDNPPCVNPDHLFLGTDADNTADRERKGRGRHPRVLLGSESRQAKLTEEDVMWIRSEWTKGKLTQKEIGRRFGIARTSVMSIVTGRNWAHLPVIKSELNHKSIKHARRRKHA